MGKEMGKRKHSVDLQPVGFLVCIHSFAQERCGLQGSMNVCVSVCEIVCMYKKLILHIMLNHAVALLDTCAYLCECLCMPVCLCT